MTSATAPVLMYHAVKAEPGSEHYAVSARTFRRQMDSIRELGRTGLSVAAWQRAPSSRDAVILTFDDGHRSMLTEVLPVLQELGFSATCYVTTGWIGSKEGFLGWSDVRQLLEAGVDVQLHGRTHAFLDARDPTILQNEIVGAVEDFVTQTGIQPTQLSLPGGRWSTKALALAHLHGIAVVSTSEPGIAQAAALTDRPALLPRLVIHQGISEARFRDYVVGAPGPIIADRRRYRLKSRLRSLVGNQLYQTFWSRVFNPPGLKR